MSFTVVNVRRYIVDVFGHVVIRLVDYWQGTFFIVFIKQVLVCHMRGGVSIDWKPPSSAG